MNLYTKSKIRGIFVLNLINLGFDNHVAESIVSGNSTYIDDVMSVQTKFIVASESSKDVRIRDFLQTQKQLDGLISLCIDKNMEKITTRTRKKT